jgi:hypothetical protein
MNLKLTLPFHIGFSFFLFVAFIVLTAECRLSGNSGNKKVSDWLVEALVRL